MICSLCTVSLCCFVYCWSVNAYCTTDTGCQPNCSSHVEGPDDKTTNAVTYTNNNNNNCST